jgi:predicted flavoprotein YhiN
LQIKVILKASEKTYSPSSKASPKNSSTKILSLVCPPAFGKPLATCCKASMRNRKWADLSKKQLQALWQELSQARYQVNGKSTFKEEFVTAGGVHLDEIDFSRFESKRHPNLFMAGEILNIDAVTGGFNFQAAWTGGWCVAQAVADVKA